MSIHINVHADERDSLKLSFTLLRLRKDERIQEISSILYLWYHVMILYSPTVAVTIDLKQENVFYRNQLSLPDLTFYINRCTD